MAVYFVPYEDKIADVLTKGSTYGQFHSLRNKLNVLPRLYSLRVDVNRACQKQNIRSLMSLRIANTVPANEVVQGRYPLQLSV